MKSFNFYKTITENLQNNAQHQFRINSGETQISWVTKIEGKKPLNYNSIPVDVDFLEPGLTGVAARTFLESRTKLEVLDLNITQYIFHIKLHVYLLQILHYCLW